MSDGARARIKVRSVPAFRRRERRSSVAGPGPACSVWSGAESSWQNGTGAPESGAQPHSVECGGGSASCQLRRRTVGTGSARGVRSRGPSMSSIGLRVCVCVCVVVDDTLMLPEPLPKSS